MIGVRSRTHYRPGPAEFATARQWHGRFTLELTRSFDQSAVRIWRLLTDPAELHEWAPFDTTFDLGETGTTTLSMAGVARAIDLPSHIRIAEPPRLLEYTWGSDVLVWEIEPLMSATVLTLRHTMNDPRAMARAAAGWQICFDVAERHLEGRPIGRIVGPEAKQFGFEKLHAEYASLLGVQGLAREQEPRAAAPPRPAAPGGAQERHDGI